MLELIVAFLLMLTQELVMLTIAVSMCMSMGMGLPEIVVMWVIALQLAILIAHEVGKALKGRLPKRLEEKRKLVEAWLRRHNMMAVYILFSFLVWAYAVVIVLTVLGERLRRIALAVNVGYGIFFALLLTLLTAGVSLTGSVITAAVATVLIFASALSIAYRLVLRKSPLKLSNSDTKVYLH